MLLDPILGLDPGLIFIVLMNSTLGERDLFGCGVGARLTRFFGGEILFMNSTLGDLLLLLLLF